MFVVLFPTRGKYCSKSEVAQHFIHSISASKNKVESTKITFWTGYVKLDFFSEAQKVSGVVKRVQSLHFCEPPTKVMQYLQRQRPLIWLIKATKVRDWAGKTSFSLIKRSQIAIAVSVKHKKLVCLHWIKRARQSLALCVLYCINNGLSSVPFACESVPNLDTKTFKNRCRLHFTYLNSSHDVAGSHFDDKLTTDSEGETS